MTDAVSGNDADSLDADPRRDRGLSQQALAILTHAMPDRLGLSPGASG